MVSSIVEALAARRTVFAFDYRGVGASGGDAPGSITAMANDMLAAIPALGLAAIDLMGFALGGFVAQDMILKRPGLGRRLILAGAGPAGGTGWMALRCPAPADDRAAKPSPISAARSGLRASGYMVDCSGGPGSAATWQRRIGRLFATVDACWRSG